MVFLKPYCSMMFFGNIVRPYDTSIKKCPWFVGPEKNIFVRKKYEPIKNFAVIRPV